MLGTTVRIEEDLLERLFTHHVKRLARAILLLARYGLKSAPQRALPKMSSRKLAKLAGIMQSNVDAYMKKFVRLGFIANDNALTANNSLLNDVLHQ